MAPRPSLLWLCSHHPARAGTLCLVLPRRDRLERFAGPRTRTRFFRNVVRVSMFAADNFLSFHLRALNVIGGLFEGDGLSSSSDAFRQTCRSP